MRTCGRSTCELRAVLSLVCFDELCDESFRKFYLRKEWLGRELFGGRILKDVGMFAKALVIPR